MRNAKVLVQALLLASVLLALGHYAYSRAAKRKKAHSHKEVKTKMSHKAHKARKTRSVRKSAATTLRGSGRVYIVTATAYQAVKSQTDSKPFITADNSRIKRGYSSKLHWLAVSQDLLRHRGGSIHYGDKVHVRGVSPKLDGVYTVHDTMHKRYRHYIDILSNPSEKLNISTKNVKLQLVKTSASRKQYSLAENITNWGRRVASSRPARSHHRGRAERPAYLASAIL